MFSRIDFVGLRLCTFAHSAPDRPRVYLLVRFIHVSCKVPLISALLTLVLCSNVEVQVGTTFSRSYHLLLLCHHGSLKISEGRRGSWNKGNLGSLHDMTSSRIPLSCVFTNEIASGESPLDAGPK